jgi:hypothetical protein
MAGAVYMAMDDRLCDHLGEVAQTHIGHMGRCRHSGHM